MFDFPEPSIIAGARDVTTVPTQALFLMNNPFVVETASQFASRLVAEQPDDAQARVQLAYRLALTREATSEEVDMVLAFIDSMKRKQQQSDVPEDSVNQLAWSSFCQTLFASSEFRYIN